VENSTENPTLFPDEVFTAVPPAAPNEGNGRPKGARNRRHRALQAVAQSQAPALLQRVINAAMNGDMMAAKIVMDRVWPKPRTAPIAVELPQVTTPEQLKTAMYDLLRRVASGELTTDDGAALVAMMKDMVAVEIATGRIDTPNVGELQTADPKAMLIERLLKVRQQKIAAATESTA
jgi:hypothetical protein